MGHGGKDESYGLRTTDRGQGVLPDVGDRGPGAGVRRGGAGNACQPAVSRR